MPKKAENGGFACYLALFILEWKIRRETTTENAVWAGGQAMLNQDSMTPLYIQLMELIEKDVPFLITSNAIEIFGKYIENEDGTKIEGLGIFDFYAKRDMMHRFNGLVKGTFKDMTIVGFKSQFTMAYAGDFKEKFIHVERGTGMNTEDDNEGICCHHFYGTYLIGPFLCLNPYFTKYLMTVMGVENPVLAHEAVIMDAYHRREKEFSNPKTKF